MFVSQGFENVGSWAALLPKNKDYATDTSTSSHMILMSSLGTNLDWYKGLTWKVFSFGHNLSGSYSFFSSLIYLFPLVPTLIGTRD